MNPLRDELERFAKEYPRLATVLASVHQGPETAPSYENGRFSLGDVHVSRILTAPNGLNGMRLSSEEIVDYLTRHTNGDHGINGSSVDVKPTQDDEWCPVLANPDARNAIAISQGYGMIHSRFSIYHDEHKTADSRRALLGQEHESTHGRRPDDYLDVVTLLAGDRSKTVVFSSRDTAGLP
jgi:hypothetical protein